MMWVRRSVTHRLSWLVASEDPEAEARVLPPQEDVLLLEVWHCQSSKNQL